LGVICIAGAAHAFAGRAPAGTTAPLASSANNPNPTRTESRQDLIREIGCRIENTPLHQKWLAPRNRLNRATDLWAWDNLVKAT